MKGIDENFRPFLLMWSGQLLSRLGSGISAFSLGVFLFQNTGSTAAYSMLLFTAFFPPILLTPIGGVAADRLDRRRLMIFGDLGSATGILCIVVFMMIYPMTSGSDIFYWPIYTGLALSSVFTGFHTPAFKSSVTDLLNEKQYAKASGLIQLAEASRYLIAPIAAVYLVTNLSLAVVLIVDICTYILAALTTVLVRRQLTFSKAGNIPLKNGAYRTGHRNAFLKNSFHDISEGFRYIRSKKETLQLLYLTTLITFCTGVLQTLFAPILLSISDAKTLGTVQSIASSGMVITSLLISFTGKTERQEKILILSLSAMAFLFVCIGASRTAFLLMVFSFALYAALPFVNTSLEVLFRNRVDNQLQGRAWSLISLISQIGMLTAFLVTGFLADHIFEPLFLESGMWADSLGRLLGTGPSRGSGFMVIIVGFILLIVSIIRKLELHNTHYLRSGKSA